MEAVEGNMIRGTRESDGEPCTGSFESRDESKIELDPYVVLGVDEEASEKEIKRAFRKWSVRYHPDKQRGAKQKNEATAKFARIREAYEILGDPNKKILFDTGGM